MKRTPASRPAQPPARTLQIALDFAAHPASSPATVAEPEAAQASAAPLDAETLLQRLSDWVDAGWLRALDLALARWLHAEVPASPPSVLLGVALLSQREGRGHGALRLSDLVGTHAAAQSAPVTALDDWLSGPAAAQDALAAVLAALPADLQDWIEAIKASPAVSLPSGTSLSQASLPGTSLSDACLSDASPPVAASSVPPLPVTTVERVSEPPDGLRTPLVFEHGLLYLRRHWREEQAVAAAVLARVAPATMGAPIGAAMGAAARGATARVAVDPAEVRQWLDRLFGPLPVAAEGAAAVDWQRVACAVALRGRLTLITGGPGTGKTYTVARLLALRFALHPDPQQLRIALAAPTGKAAARLKQSIDLALDALRTALPTSLDWTLLAKRLAEALTLHKLLGARPDTRRLRHHAGHPLEVDLLVVDEASMVHLEMMDALLAALPAPAQLVLLGDRDQLASVEAGAVLGDLCGDTAPVANAATREWIAACTGQSVPHTDAPQTPLSQQTVMLRVSRRFDGLIGELARAVNAGDAASARRLLAAGSGGAASPVAWVVPAQLDDVLHLAFGGGGSPGQAAPSDEGLLASLALVRGRPTGADPRAHEAWVGDVLAAFDRQRLLCALREGDWGVSGVNRRIEAALRARGAIARSGEWYEGRPVMVTRNDPALGVFNGDLGVALRGAGPGAGLRVWFQDGERLRSVLASRLNAVETAYAMTVHKSQGSEFAHTVLVLPPQASSVLTRELVYTGITRARTRFTLVAPDVSVLDAALRVKTRRTSGLAWRLGKRSHPKE